MKNMVTYFPVGTADMSLVQLADGYTILIDCYIQEEATENRPAIADDLYKCLPEDVHGRPYVDAFLLTHPDQDHCKGAVEFLHLGKPEDYKNNSADGTRKKIFIREMWSSPLIYRRAQRDAHVLCDDAKEINREAIRRVNEFKRTGQKNVNGNSIRVIGSDYKNDAGASRLDGLDEIRTKVDETFQTFDDARQQSSEIYVLAPLNATEIEGDNEVLSKNNSSIVLQMSINSRPGAHTDNTLVFGGDSEVEIWKRLWDKHSQNVRPLIYDILLAPHHCSWGVLSNEAASDRAAQSDNKARHAFSQGRDNCFIVTSSQKIVDNLNLPPMLKAKNEYIDILEDAVDHFYNTGAHPTTKMPTPLIFKFTENGPQAPSKITPVTPAVAAPAIVAREPRGHGGS